ncbi:MAG: uridine kinase [Kiritimatiellia bacterium]|jgi:uridine kinase
MSIIVGIGGGTASGKTTVSRELCTALGSRAVLILHDRYYRSLSTGEDPATHNYDHPDALETSLLVEHLASLRAGTSACLPRYSFERHRREAGFDQVEQRPIILVEGILVLADPALRACLDHTVFVHAPSDIRLMRRLRRDVAERGRDAMGILQRYERTVRPMHERFVEPSRAFAEVVLDGTQDVQLSVKRMLRLMGETV